MGKYLYCIIPCAERKEFGQIGLAESPVFTVNYKELACVASEAPLKACYPTRQNALAHERVIAAVMKEFPVIPMSFGLVCKSSQAAELLKNNYHVFCKKLDYLTDKIELGLKVWWQKESFEQEIFSFDPKLAGLKHKIENAANENTYLQTVEFGKLVEQAADGLRDKYQALIFNPLRDMCLDAKLNEHLVELMVFNAAFLLDKNREKQFDLKVNEIYLAHKEKLAFKYTGPWPPYNFVNLHIKGI